MKATDAYRKINNSPIKGIVLYYTEQILQMEKVELGSVIYQIQTGKTPPKANLKYYSSPDVNWFKPSDIGYEKYLEEANEKFSNIAVKEKKATIYSKDTLLLIGIGGGVGRVSILKEEGSSNQQITGIKFNEKVSPQYAYYYYLVREEYVKSQAKSMSFPILNQSKIKELEFRYPSVPEQNEFVKFIDACWHSFLNNVIPDISSFEISPELKEYALKQFKAIELDDKIQKNIENELTLLSNLKQSILQEAIQGKLTADWRALRQAQDSPIEPASELLKRIKAEKAQLIKDKKIKKEKPLPPITAEEIPFELPEGWVWCRLGEISDIQRGSSPRPKGDKRYFSDIKTKNNWISISDISSYCKENVLLETKEFLTDLGTKYSRFVYENEFIIAVSGSTTGKCCLTGIEGYIYDGLAFVRLHNQDLYPKFLLNYMVQLYSHINNSKEGASFPNINTGFLNDMLYPLMSIEEQKVIVEKVESLMQKCQALEQEIKTSEANAQMLMQAVLKEAFEGKQTVAPV